MGADGGLGRVLHEPKVTTEPPEQPVATGKNRPIAVIRFAYKAWGDLRLRATASPRQGSRFLDILMKR